MTPVVAATVLAVGTPSLVNTPDYIAFQKQKAALIAAADKQIDESKKLRAKSVAAVAKALDTLARAEAALEALKAKKAAEQAERKRKDD